MREETEVLRSWESGHLLQRQTRGIVRLGFGNLEHCVFEPSVAWDEEEKGVVARLPMEAQESVGGRPHLNEI
jgi:hypothetical protein